MSLSTGTATPSGTIITGEGIYIEGGPAIYFQDYTCAERFSPDGDGHYWGLSGTVACPVYQFACYDDFQIMDDVTNNPITCQNLGEVSNLQRRNHVGISFTLKDLLDFSILSRVLRGGAVTVNATDDTEGFGVGEIVSKDYHVFASRVYDQSTGDYISLTIHKARIISASPISTPYADAWNVPVEMHGFADTTKPADQRFATWKRLDPDQIP